MSPETPDQKLGVDLTSMVVPLLYTSLYIFIPFVSVMTPDSWKTRRIDLTYPNLCLGKLLSLEIISVCDSPCQQLLAETMLLFC